jgi:7,8-dihydro-6-hydroxymethylpterin-pyrophosphokinase
MRMTQVYIGIGSNIDKVKNINGSLSSLRNYFGKINVSPSIPTALLWYIGETLILPK